ncbi:MAG: hypothetical protein ACOWWM_05150 [Desulfobacterales bacterium]
MSIKKIVATSLMLGLLVMPVAGCQWMGEKSGQAANQVEEGAEEFEEGYDKTRKD